MTTADVRGSQIWLVSGKFQVSKYFWVELRGLLSKDNVSLLESTFLQTYSQLGTCWADASNITGFRRLDSVEIINGGSKKNRDSQSAWYLLQANGTCTDCNETDAFLRYATHSSGSLGNACLCDAPLETDLAWNVQQELHQHQSGSLDRPGDGKSNRRLDTVSFFGACLGSSPPNNGV